MTLKPTLEPVLPELGEPGVAEVDLRAKVEVVIIKPGDISRLELNGDSTSSFLLISVRHIMTISPSITGKTDKQTKKKEEREENSQKVRN